MPNAACQPQRVAIAAAENDAQHGADRGRGRERSEDRGPHPRGKTVRQQRRAGACHSRPRPIPTSPRSVSSCAKLPANAHAMVAALQTNAIAKMLFTRLQRSASNATGIENRPTVRETIEINPPSCVSLSPHSVLMNGSIETMIWRSMKSNTINRHVRAKTDHAARLEPR